MKRISVLGFLLASTFGVSHGAETTPEFSVFAGPQCDRPAVEDGASFESSCSVQPLVGAAVSVGGPGRSRLETEGQYSRRSFRSPAFVTDTSVRADFLEIALLSAWPIHEGSGGFRLEAVAGPQAGFLLRARRRFRGVDQNVANELKAVDLKLVAALRLARRAGERAQVFVEGGIVWGLTDLDDTNHQQIRARGVVLKFGLTR